MKKLLAALTLALLFALVVVSGVASAASPNDFTTGGGKAERSGGTFTVEEKFAFSAHDEDDNPATSAGNGHFVYEFTFTSPAGTSEIDIKGSVDCVRVVGNRAGFSGLVEKSSSDPSLEGQRAIFSATDNDQPPSSGAAPDGFRFAGFTQLGPQFCPLLATTPITSGNILVRDAQ